MKYTVDFRLAPEGGAKTKSSFVVNEAQKLEITNAFRYLADYIVFSDTDGAQHWIRRVDVHSLIIREVRE